MYIRTQGEMELINKVKAEFLKIGFSNEQISKLIGSRQNRTDTKIPFLYTDIQKRFKEFQKIFSKYTVAQKDIYDILSQGLLFSQLPSALDNLLTFVAEKGVSPELFLKKLSTTSNGCYVLGMPPSKIKKNIMQMGEALKDYNISEKKWIELSFKRPSLLRLTASYILGNLKKMDAFLADYGFDEKDLVKAAKLNPSVFDKDAETLIAKTKEMFAFIKKYHIEPKEWIRASLKVPQLLYHDPKHLQEHIEFYQNMFQKKLFVFAKKPDADSTYLMRYLLTSPQALCFSKENLMLRERFARFLIEKNGFATSTVLYRTKKYIQKEMQKGL